MCGLGLLPTLNILRCIALPLALLFPPFFSHWVILDCMTSEPVLLAEMSVAVGWVEQVHFYPAVSAAFQTYTHTHCYNSASDSSVHK